MRTESRWSIYSIHATKFGYALVAETLCQVLREVLVGNAVTVSQE